MPAGRPRGRPPGSTNKNPQQRLSFGPNATNKITKPSPLSQSHTKKLSPTQKSTLSAAVADEIETPEPEIETPTKETPIAQEEEAEEDKALPIRQPSQQDVKVPSTSAQDPKEAEAQKVSEAQIKKYWKLKEEARIAPRVHQKGISVHEKVLREFDLSSQFGVCCMIFFLLRVWLVAFWGSEETNWEISRV